MNPTVRRSLALLALFTPGLAWGGAIPGDPSALVNDAIPSLAYEPAYDQFLTGHPEAPEVPLSVDTVLIEFVDGTTVDQANALLDAHGGWLVGGSDGQDGVAPALAVVRFPIADHAGMDALVAALAQDPVVEAVERDAALDGDALPPVASTTSSLPAPWTWALGPAGGNYGYEQMAMPQTWNWNAAIDKAGDRVHTLVIDLGFDTTHPDLDVAFDGSLGLVSDHGTHVAGTIGANWGNDAFVDGVNPFADLSVVTISRPASSRIAFGGLLIAGLELGMSVVPDTRVVNISLAYNWRSLTSTGMLLASVHGKLFKGSLKRLDRRGDVPVVVCAAGNLPGVDAAWQSPCNAAGLVWGAAPVIVVESVDVAGASSSFSSVGGDVSAGGESVRSLLSGASSGPKTGTSMSAPHVSGLVGYLYALDPSLPSPSLTSNPVKDLVLAEAKTGSGGAPIVHAFDAAMAIDGLRGDDFVVELLTDIDDGTPDGNQRQERAPGMFGTTDWSTVDDDGDGGLGDGGTDMSDFRRFRDWVLQTEGTGTLDGTFGHPNKDVNGDSLLSVPLAEGKRYARGDFNGDGIVSSTASRTVPVLGAVTDLDVLRVVFADPDYAAADLPGLMTSGDLEVWPYRCVGGRTSRFEVTVSTGGVVVETRTSTPVTARDVFTRTRAQLPYTVEVVGYDAVGLRTSSATTTWDPVVPGSDAWFSPVFCP